MKYYIVHSKPDDYGARKTDVVETTEDNAEQYYECKEVPTWEEIEVLKRYLDFVPYEDEKKRSNEERFYGNS